MTTTNKKGWQLLHSPLPKEALKPLHRSVYGVANLTDVNEGYLIERLHQSGLEWNLRPLQQEYLGIQVKREGDPPRDRTYHLASFLGILEIETEVGSGKFRSFAATGASDNVRLDAAFKGAKTTGFKSACKEAGLTTELYKDLKAMDVFYDQVPDEVTNPIARNNAAAFEAQQQQTSQQQTQPAAATQEQGRPSNGPLTPTQQQILSALYSSVPEDPDAREKSGAAFKAAEAREAGSGYDAAFAALVELHNRHHGADCEHVKAAYDTAFSSAAGEAA